VRLELPVLLPARLGEVVRIVVRADDDLLRPALAEHLGDVDGERSVAALVLRAAAFTQTVAAQSTAPKCRSSRSPRSIGGASNVRYQTAR
jgi:hypothetical protein